MLQFVGLTCLFLVVASLTGPALDPATDKTLVLGTAEVRERQAALSDGRTTSDLAAAPGLLDRDASAPEAFASPIPLPSSAPSSESAPPTPSEVASDERQPTQPAKQPAWGQSDGSVGPIELGELNKQTQVGRDLGDSSRGDDKGTEVDPDTVESVGPTVAERSLEAETLERIALDWQHRLPGWDVVFLGPNSGLRGLTLTEQRRIEISVRPTDTPQSVARVLAHELGHVLLDTAFHTDDRGADRPWLLMDGNAFARGSSGPRRLSQNECREARLHSGIGATPALLRRSDVR